MALIAIATPCLAQTPGKWGPHIDLEGKLGNQRSLGEADAFVPFWQDGTTLLFGNFRGRLDDDNGREGNFGLAFRHMLGSGWNLGAYGYYDRRKTENRNYFNQTTVGVEALSLEWDFRANLYTPFGDRTKILPGSVSSGGASTASLVGTSVVVTTPGSFQQEEKSLAGYDAEIGWRVPLWSGEAEQQLRVFAGAYRFYADGVNPVQGPRARTELTFDEVPFLWDGSRFTLGGEVQHDGPRGRAGFATARLRIPLQAFTSAMPAVKLTPMERRMADPIVRDIDIVSQSYITTMSPALTETATATSGGGTLTVMDSGTTNGTANIQTALNNAGANSTVILNGTFTTTTTVTLQSGQTLMAGSTTVTVQTPSGRTATLTPSTTASITSSAAGNTGTLDMAANSTVKGLTLSATGGNSRTIRINGVSGASVQNNTISANNSGTGDAWGISASGAGATGLILSGNTITATSSAGMNATGIEFSGGASATISNNSVTGTSTGGGGGAAMQISGGTQTVSGNTLNASGAAFDRAADIAGVTFNTASSTGNVLSSGVCNSGGGVTGSMSFTNATTCP